MMETTEISPGVFLKHHPSTACSGPCSIHNPSKHSMRNFTLHWRGDRGMMERLCPHGIGHPDPDHVAFIKSTGSFGRNDFVHGCDGCCV